MVRAELMMNWRVWNGYSVKRADQDLVHKMNLGVYFIG